jgi:hypothetical protein
MISVLGFILNIKFVIKIVELHVYGTSVSIISYLLTIQLKSVTTSAYD